MSQSSYYTLITGASHGIGKALAEQCAARGMNLILVALPDGLLEVVASDIVKKYSVDVRVFACDLINETSIDEMYAWYLEQNLQINFLINNAGFGTSGYFEEINIQTITKMLALNNGVLVRMSHAFVPELKKLDKAFILNLGSMESLLPLPYKTVYTATKKFNYGFSLALREELKPHNISVSLLCPGPVPTHQGSVDRIIAQGWKGRILAKMPEEVASLAIKHTLRGKNIIVTGTTNRVFAQLGALIPVGMRMFILEKLARGFLKKDDDKEAVL